MNDFDQIVAIKRRHEEHLISLPGVHGVSIGYKKKGQKRTSELAIIVHLHHKLAVDEIPEKELIPTEIEGIVTDVIEHPQPSLHLLKVSKEEYEALTKEDGKKYRPLECGCQIAVKNKHDDDGQIGTLGCFANLNIKGIAAPTQLVTCQHVVVHAEGDYVYQPYIGTSSFKFASVSGTVLSSTVDAARAEIGMEFNYKPHILGIGDISGTYSITLADLKKYKGAYPVKKRGRTTRVTSGSVTAIYYSGKFADNRKFKDQLYIESSDPKAPFSDHGDSGSVIVNDKIEVVGLLWGGDPKFTVACNVADLEKELQVLIISK